MSALFDHWSKTGKPIDRTVTQRIHAALAARASGSSDWRTLLDHAMSDLRCTVDWQDGRVNGITIWGEEASEVTGNDAENA